jgi:hypothetical protein
MSGEHPGLGLRMRTLAAEAKRASRILARASTEQ